MTPINLYFVISGNHEDPLGNPIPYVRSTRDALWRADGKRYAAWKEYVRGAYLAAAGSKGILTPKEVVNLNITGEKPIKLERGQRARIDLTIYWKNGAHGDPDNIWKGIADALFKNDRNVDGSFESYVKTDGQGTVHVKLQIL
ncbi:MAG: hypothetical protein AB1352_03590 [Patescibacteria group bacterium]